MRITRRAGPCDALLAALLIAIAAVGGPTTPGVVQAYVRTAAGVASLADLGTPHVLGAAIAEVIVRVRGSSVCSGTPISGARLVVTAAHCILDGDGHVTAVTVVRDGVEYVPRAALVNRRYHDQPSPHLDAAVLVMEPALPGRTATLGDVVPTQGFVTIAGLQRIDTDGALLRGTSYRDRPLPTGATGGVVEIESRPAGCVERATSIEIANDELKAGCGLVPGGSGGGLFTSRDGGLELVGIISTVGFDLSYNGLTRVSAVDELLNHPGDYTHALPQERVSLTQPSITRQ
jgi:hypothetical protein